MSEFQAITNAEMAAGRYITSSLLARLRNNIQGLAEGRGVLAQKVLTGAIAAGTLPGTAWKDNSITSAKIGANLIGDSQIAAGAITASKLKLATSYISFADNSASYAGSNTNLKWKIGYKTWAEPNAGGNFSARYNFLLGWDSTGGYDMPSEISYYMIKEQSGRAGGPLGYVFLWFSYLNASPPFDLGDGEIPLFVFLQQGPGGEFVEAMTCDTTPPWYDSADFPVARRDMVDGEVRKFQAEKTMKPADWGDKAARVAYLAALRNPTEGEEITPASKNARMPHKPHPFLSVLPANRPVLIEPAGDLMHQLAAIHHDGGNVLSLIQNGYIVLGDDLPNRAGPPGVTILGARWRKTERSSAVRPKPFKGKVI